MCLNILNPSPDSLKGRYTITLQSVASVIKPRNISANEGRVRGNTQGNLKVTNLNNKLILCDQTTRNPKEAFRSEFENCVPICGLKVDTNIQTRSLRTWCPPSRKICCPHLQHQRLEQHVHPKRQYSPTRPYGVTTLEGKLKTGCSLTNSPFKARWFTLRTTRFNIQKFDILSTRYTSVFYMALGTNSDYVSIHKQLACFCNGSFLWAILLLNYKFLAQSAMGWEQLNGTGICSAVC